MITPDQRNQRRLLRAALWRLVMNRPEILDIVADELADCLEEQRAHDAEERRAWLEGEDHG